MSITATGPRDDQVEYQWDFSALLSKVKPKLVRTKVLKMKLADFVRVYRQSRIDYQVAALHSEIYTTRKTGSRIFGRSPKT